MLRLIFKIFDSLDKLNFFKLQSGENDLEQVESETNLTCFN